MSCVAFTYKLNYLKAKMYKPQNIQKNYKDLTRPVERNIPKSLSAFFFILQFGFGFDFGFTKDFKQNLRRFCNVITFLVGVAITIIQTAPFQRNMACLDVYWYTTQLMYYIVYWAILNFFTLYNIYDFIKDMNNIGKSDTVMNKEKIGLFTFAYTFVFFFFKIILYFVHCSYGNCVYYIPFSVYVIHSHSTNVMPTVITLIYGYIYSAVKQLTRESIETDLDIDTIRKNYMSIRDCFDKIKKLHDNLFMAMLIFELPHMIGMTWFLLFFIKEEMGWLKYFLEIVYCVHIVVQLTVSAVGAEMINVEYEALRLKLHDMWISTRDEDKIAALRHLLRYMKVQPLHHKAWRMIPTDLRLLVSLFSLCATYLIVVVQFTHLYG